MSNNPSMSHKDGNRKDASRVVWKHETTLHDVCNLRSAFMKDDDSNDASDDAVVVCVLLMYGSWNKRNSDVGYPAEASLLTTLADKLTHGLEDCQSFAAVVQVDGSDESLSLCIGDDNDNTNEKNLPLPPSELPALAIVARTASMNHSVLRYVPRLRSSLLEILLMGSCSFDDDHVAEDDPVNILFKASRTTMQSLESELDLAVSWESCNQAIRIFVAGDKSSVGKSSVCLGILGNLLQVMGYSAEKLAYIKPATQSESTQLIQLFCQASGIE